MMGHCITSDCSSFDNADRASHIEVALSVCSDHEDCSGQPKQPPSKVRNILHCSSI